MSGSKLERIAIEHLPHEYAVYSTLFRDVENAAFLQSQLIARNSDFEYAFIDASAVVSRAHFLAAVYRAVLAHASKTLKTPNLHSETVLSLSPSMNIAEAYRRYGVTADTKNVLVVKIIFQGEQDSGPKIWEHLSTNVQGTAVLPSNSEIWACTDVSKVQKYFKLNSIPFLAGKKDVSEIRKDLEVCVLGSMALRGL